MEHFEKVTGNKKQYLELLLLADPSEEMIDKYLEAGEMFTLSQQGHVICEAVVDPYGELKNLAVFLKKTALSAVFLFLKLLELLSSK